MKKISLGKLAASALALCAFAVQAQPITYTFTGVMDPGYGFDNQTVAGFLTVDSSQYTTVDGDGVTFAQGSTNGTVLVVPPTGQLSLSGGLNISLGSTSNAAAESYIYKNAQSPTNQFIVDVTSVANNVMSFVQLRTWDAGASPLAIFPGAPTDNFSFSQPVVFNTGNSSNVGYFSLLTLQGNSLGSGNFTITSVTVSGASVVPEPSTSVFMVLGLLAIANLRRARRASSLH